MSKVLYIPCGFRCFTKDVIKERFGIQQPSLPFDSGYFSSSSIIKFMESGKFEINLNNTNPCIKKENLIKDSLRGIDFKEVSYDFINEFIKKNGYNNSYLDATKGYYTLVKEFGFVLAHYNWHSSANERITNPKENIEIVNEILNRRKARLFDLINASSEINLCLYLIHGFSTNNKPQPKLKGGIPTGQRFIIINNEYHNLKDEFALLENYFKQKFEKKKIKLIYL